MNARSVSDAIIGWIDIRPVVTTDPVETVYPVGAIAVGWETDESDSLAAALSRLAGRGGAVSGDAFEEPVAAMALTAGAASVELRRRLPAKPRFAAWPQRHAADLATLASELESRVAQVLRGLELD